MKRHSSFPGFKTRQQIADEYGITVKTLKNHLDQKDFALPKGLRVTITEQKSIYDTLGWPPGVSKMDYQSI